MAESIDSGLAADGYLTLCRECDWVFHLPARAVGEAAHCPRCHHHIAATARSNAQAPMAWALAALIALGLVFVFDFLSFSTRGVGHTMAFADAAGSLFADDYIALGLLFLATTAILPGLYLAAVLYLYAGQSFGARLPGARVIARTLRPLEPWLMSDVFIVGVLVALIKIVSLASIHIGTAFVAFCVYSLLLLRTFSLIDWTALWDTIAPRRGLPAVIKAGRGGQAQGLAVCHGCDTPFMKHAGHRCPRCGKRHFAAAVNRLQLTWALLATATILYIPANLFPVLATETLGNAEPQTIIAGVVHLAAAGSWPIALVIFVASIVVPISKIAALAWLCLAAQYGWHRSALTQTRLYRITEKVGRWSMIDVFVVATLGALVHAGQLMSITPGPGVVSFALVVVITMIAALTFDTRLLWRAAEADEGSRQGDAE